MVSGDDLRYFLQTSDCSLDIILRGLIYNEAAEAVLPDFDFWESFQGI